MGQYRTVHRYEVPVGETRCFEFVSFDQDPTRVEAKVVREVPGGVPSGIAVEFWQHELYDYNPAHHRPLRFEFAVVGTGHPFPPEQSPFSEDSDYLWEVVGTAQRLEGLVWHLIRRRVGPDASYDGKES